LNLVPSAFAQAVMIKPSLASSTSTSEFDENASPPWASRRAELTLVDLTRASWNPLISWLRQIDQLRRAA
jgi:hypothetical protein